MGNNPHFEIKEINIIGIPYEKDLGNKTFNKILEMIRYFIKYLDKYKFWFNLIVKFDLFRKHHIDTYISFLTIKKCIADADVYIKLS